MAERRYMLLGDQEQHDAMVQTYLANERDHYLHTKNLERFTLMLDRLPPGPFRERIQKLQEDTIARLEEVSAILDATIQQLPEPATLNASLLRVQARERV